MHATNLITAVMTTSKSLQTGESSTSCVKSSSFVMVSLKSNIDQLLSIKLIIHTNIVPTLVAYLVPYNLFALCLLQSYTYYTHCYSYANQHNNVIILLVKTDYNSLAILKVEQLARCKFCFIFSDFSIQSQIAYLS